MALVEVIDVTLSGDAGVEGAIESPEHGASSDSYVLAVFGWVAGRESRARSVELLHGGRLLRSALVRVERPDLGRAEADGDSARGFRTLVGVLSLPEEFDLELVTVLENGARVPLGTIRARHERVRTGVEPQLAPLTVSCLPRTGSTWLMRILASHPEVVVYPLYPYEYGAARYFGHMLTVLAEPANGVESDKPGNFDVDFWHVGHNPFHRPRDAAHEDLGPLLGRDYVEMLAGFVQRSIDDYYAAVARSQGKEGAAYFAEKYFTRSGKSAAMLRELYPGGREVFLVRDFRDAVCSRVTNGTGEEDTKADERLIRQWGRLAANLLDSWRLRGDGALLLHYEDLVLEPEPTVERLLGYLELDSSPGSVADLLTAATAGTTYPRMQAEGHEREFEVHATSETPEASIGRWREHLRPGLQDLCRQSFADALEAFGYAPAPR